MVSARSNLPQAPICESCNNEKSKLEHYLTAVLPFGGRHVDASENLASMVPKRLGKNVRLHRRLEKGQKIVFVPNHEGKLEGTIAIPFDGERLEGLFSMVARGLAWYHWRLYLEPAMRFRPTRLLRAGCGTTKKSCFAKTCAPGLATTLATIRSFTKAFRHRNTTARTGVNSVGCPTARLAPGWLCR